MKKRALGTITASMALLLAACNQSATTEEENTGTATEETAAEETAAEESGPNVAEIYTKMLEANNNVESFSSTSTSEQMISSNEEEGMNMTINMDLKQEVVMEPFASYNEITMNMSGDDMPEGQGAMDMEMYMMEDALYVYEPTSDMWMKMPMEMMGDLTGSFDVDPAEQYKQLEPFADSFEVEESGDAYIMTLNAEGEEFNTLLQDLMDESLATTGMTEDPAMQEVLDGMTFENVQYVFTIDKESYLVNEMDVSLVMNMSMEEQGETMTATIDQKMSTVFDGYNNVDEITVPQEVIDNAVDMTE